MIIQTQNTINNNSSKETQKILNNNIEKYYINTDNAKNQYANLDLAKKRAGSIKHRVLNNLDKYLVEFEASFTKRGGKVIWALDSQQALNEIYNIILKNDINSVVKSKSVLSKEIGLNEFLKSKSIDLKETDLIDFVNKGLNDNNAHNSLNNNTKEEIFEYLVQKYGLSKDKKINEIIHIINKIQKESILNSDIAIVEGNFIISDIGGIAISEEDGNAILASSFSKINIVLISIDRVIPNFQDLDLFLPLLSTFSNGQKISAYNTIITGSKQESESDGPNEIYVILIDNERSEVLSKKEQRRALSCISCGACANYCPVFKIIGEQTYDSIYKGPVGYVVTPYLKGIKEYSHLSFASTLCGKCSEKCPVNIPLHELLLHNRNDFNKTTDSNIKEKALIWSWKKIIHNRKLMNFISPKIKNKFISLLFNNIWGQSKKNPLFASKSFNQMWREKLNKL